MVAGLFGMLVACQQSTEAPKEEAAAPAAEAPAEEAAEATGEPGTINVTVKFEGAAPEAAKLDRKADPYCAKTAKTDPSVLVNGNGTLKNVAVSLKKVRGKFEVPAENLTLTQSECMYEPRVQTAMVGQKLEITNGDSTLHNVHSYKGEALQNWFNRAQPPKAPAITETLSGDIATFKCDVHPWMASYVVLSKHPFHGVTGDEGAVALANVPSSAKAYTITTWHEKYGAQEAEVTVEAGKTAEVTVTYKAQ